MTNREKYEKEIMDIFCNRLKHPALTKEGLQECGEVDCEDCLFNGGDCDYHFQKWLRSEYKEPEIDWTKVPVDTKILVRNSEDSEWVKRHFCAYVGGYVTAFHNGKTSWSAPHPDNYGVWYFSDIADPEEKKKYLKFVWE